MSAKIKSIDTAAKTLVATDGKGDDHTVSYDAGVLGAAKVGAAVQINSTALVSVD